MNSTDGELQTSPGAACDWLGWFRLSSFPASTHDSPKMFPAKIKHKILRKGALPACLSVLRSNLSLNGKLSSGVGTEHVELTQIGCLNTLELIGNKSEHKMVWVWSRYLREIKKWRQSNGTVYLQRACQVLCMHAPFSSLYSQNPC